MRKLVLIAIIIALLVTTTKAMDWGNAQQEPEPSAPDNFYLWCLLDHQIKAEDFYRYVDRFQVLDSGNTHLFQAYPGDWCFRNGTAEKYTRIEACDYKKFNLGSPWHEFEATYEIDTESTHKICFYQLKSHQNELPQLMCHITAGKLTYQPAGKGARTLANIANKQNFKIKVRCNGDILQLYYNDVFIYGGVPTYMMSGVENYSRWGIYDNLVIEKYMSVLAKNIKLGLSQPMVEFVSPTKDTTLVEGYSGLYVKVNTPPSSIAVSSVELFLDGKSLGSSSSMPYEWGSNTTGESNPFVGLPVGVHILKAVAYQNNNVLEEQTRIIRVTKEQEPYKESLFIPGIIEAEDYDLGGEGVSYHDSDTSNQGGIYRNDGVDIESGASGFVVGNTVKGEWMEYTVDVAQSGEYDLHIYYSSGRPGGGARISVSFPDENSYVVTNKVLPETDGWSAYSDFSLGFVNLEKGIHILRIAVADYGFNLDRIEFKKEINVSAETVFTKGIRVYPNPSTDGLFTLSKNSSWQVYSATGVKVSEGMGTSVDLSAFSKGLYLIRTNYTVKKLWYQ